MRLPPILSLLVLFLLLVPACAGNRQTLLPPIVPPASEKAAPQKDVPRPRGFVGDPRTHVFHRLDCPKVSSIPKGIREYFAVPWDALNAHYSPCETCRPLKGWK